MKRIVCFFVLFLFSSNVYAKTFEEIQEQCAYETTFAEQIMSNRQSGVPLSRVFQVLDEPVENEELYAPDSVDRKIIDLTRKIQKLIAIEAYSKPRYETPTYQAKAIRDFADSYHVECMENGIKKLK